MWLKYNELHDSALATLPILTFLYPDHCGPSQNTLDCLLQDPSLILFGGFCLPQFVFLYTFEIMNRFLTYRKLQRVTEHSPKHTSLRMKKQTNKQQQQQQQQKPKT